jgi:ribosome maturation factor RimP
MRLEAGESRFNGDFMDLLSRNDMNEKIAALLERVALEEHFDVVDVEWHPLKRQSLMKATIDKPGGITIDECQQVSKRLQYLLEVEKILPESYRLEVSSPGVFYEFKHLADYSRNIGKRVLIHLLQPIHTGAELHGIVESFDGTSLQVRTEEGEVLSLTVEGIRKIRLDPILFPATQRNRKTGTRKGKKWAGK